MTEPFGFSHRVNSRYTLDAGETGLATRVSWGAILAGVALALSLQFLLNLLGVGVGAAVIDPATSDYPTAATFSIASAVWFAVAGIVAAFAGGYVASRLSGRPDKTTGGYQGLTSWAVTTLFILYLLTTSVGAIVGGAFSGIGSLVGGLGKTVVTVATTAAPFVANSGNPMSGIEQQIRSASGGNDPQALRDAAVAAMQAVVSGDPAQADDARQRAAQAIARAQGIPVDQAKAQVTQYEDQYRRSLETAKQSAISAAQATSKVLTTGTISIFVALLLCAIASWFGGIVGTRATFGR